MVKKKRLDRRGESIAETLVAVLIIALAFVIMCGAVLSSARVNEAIKNENVAFSVSDSDLVKKNDSSSSVTVTIKQLGESGVEPATVLEETVAVTSYTTQYKDKNDNKVDLYTYYDEKVGE